MIPRERIALLVVAEAPLRHQLIAALRRGSRPVQLPVAGSLAQACACAARLAPAVILLEESAAGGQPLEAAARALLAFAPVVVVASPARQGEFAELAASGALDFVAAAGDFLPLACVLLGRRLNHTDENGPHGEPSQPDEAEDFGELLRHEVNNPLTGILGNAELLLSRHRQGRITLAPDTVERLKTIAELAVRLRETIHRLSGGGGRKASQAASSCTR